MELKLFENIDKDKDKEKYKDKDKDKLSEEEINRRIDDMQEKIEDPIIRSELTEEQIPDIKSRFKAARAGLMISEGEIGHPGTELAAKFIKDLGQRIASISGEECLTVGDFFADLGSLIEQVLGYHIDAAERFVTIQNIAFDRIAKINYLRIRLKDLEKELEMEKYDETTYWDSIKHRDLESLYVSAEWIRIDELDHRKIKIKKIEDDIGKVKYDMDKELSGLSHNVDFIRSTKNGSYIIDHMLRMYNLDEYIERFV